MLPHACKQDRGSPCFISAVLYVGTLLPHERAGSTQLSDSQSDQACIGRNFIHMPETSWTDNPPTRGRHVAEGLARPAVLASTVAWGPRVLKSMTEELGGPEPRKGGSASLFRVKRCGIQFSHDLFVARPHAELLPKEQARGLRVVRCVSMRPFIQRRVTCPAATSRMTRSCSMLLTRPGLLRSHCPSLGRRLPTLGRDRFRTWQSVGPRPSWPITRWRG